VTHPLDTWRKSSYSGEGGGNDWAGAFAAFIGDLRTADWPGR